MLIKELDGEGTQHKLPAVSMNTGSVTPEAEVLSCVPAEPAATIIVLRDVPAGAEVLLLKRDARLRFMPNLWVFPGGRMDDEDSIADPEAELGDPAMALLGTVCRSSVLPVNPRTASGLVVAAARELREETGLTLLSLKDESQKSAPDKFCEFAAMIYWARWITPSAAPRRFDTHFFAGCVSAEQGLTVAKDEVSDAKWLDPSDAVLAIEQGAMESAGPTLTVLRDLCHALQRHATARSMLLFEQGRYTTPILPKMASSGTGTDLLLPWDPGYGACSGAGLSMEGEAPEHWRQWPSRMAVTT